MRPSLRAALLSALLLLSGCKVPLYSRLTETEAVEIVAVLMRHGIEAGRVVAKDGTNTVEVEKDRLADAVDILRSQQLPREKFASMGEVFAQQGLVASPTEERARFIYALSQELSRTLSGIDGVLSARVHVVLPHNDPLRQEEEPAAAAVFLRHDARVPIDQILPQVKLLVANSIQGLSYDKVTVVLLPVAPPPLREPPPPAPQAFGVPVPDVPGGLALGGVAALLVLGGGGFLFLRRRKPKGAALVPVADAPAAVGAGAPALKGAA